MGLDFVQCYERYYVDNHYATLFTTMLITNVNAFFVYKISSIDYAIDFINDL